MTISKTVYVIEHLESRVWRWCEIEYKSISEIVGRENLWFTNVKNGSKILENYGKVFKESVSKLGLDLKKVCVLDPASNVALKTTDKNEFEYYVFGGILGDYPPRERTRVELTPFLKGAGVRNIGKEQFSTDNAVYIVSEILNGKSMNDFKFQDEIEVEIKDGESVMLPYRYPLINGKPRMSQELVTYLKRKKSF